MECPKDKTPLESIRLTGNLPAFSCPHCRGSWIPPENYVEWQEQQPYKSYIRLPDPDFTCQPAAMDAKAGLCPECKIIMSRSRVGSRTPFYVERCGRCGGIWCDTDEWETLRSLELDTVIEMLFTSEWQSKVKELEYADRERRATIEKLGEDLANQVFALAERLEQHPYGDFGVAYLMRRFDSQSDPKART